MYFEASYRVDSRDVDLLNRCRPSALLGYLQEAATEGATQCGMSRTVMVEQYNAIWILARIWCRLDSPLNWNDTLTIRTWHRGNKGVAMYRDFDIFRDGKPIGEAVSLWVVADLNTHKLMRTSHMTQFEVTDGGALCKEKPLPKLKIPVPLSEVDRRVLHYSDTDVNGHVNNTRYADFACDALQLHTLGQDRFVSELEISFLRECYPGEELTLATGNLDENWYIRGCGEGNTSRFDSRLTLTRTP